MSAVKYWLWLTTRDGVTPNAIHRLLERFETPEQLYYADRYALERLPDLSKPLRQSLREKSMDPVERILENCERLGVRIMTLQDAHYPGLLKEIYDPPAVLYLLGRSTLPDDVITIGVVGARKPTVYGLGMAEKIGGELARGGAVLVSGIAKGIDAAALRGALKSGGSVVSVLGGGVDVHYPRENAGLYEDVASRGVLVSEYPPGTENRGEHFPVRNRIISGLSLGVVAVECRVGSGTMRTMRLALEQNRGVFAVPGNVGTPQSEGPHYLIREGAILVCSGGQILEEYRSYFPLVAPEWAAVNAEAPSVQKLQPSFPPPPSWEKESLSVAAPQERGTDSARKQRGSVPEPENGTRAGYEAQSPEEQVILDALGQAALTGDELMEKCGLDARKVNSLLTVLQINGAISEGAGRRFSLS